MTLYHTLKFIAPLFKFENNKIMFHSLLVSVTVIDKTALTSSIFQTWKIHVSFIDNHTQKL